MDFLEMERMLGMTDDAAMRLEMVMDFGARMPAPPVGAVCTEITGCASRVEICRDGVHFYGRADSALVRGIVAILVAMVDGKSPDEIRQMGLRDRFAKLNLMLGAGRLTGLNSMIRFLENL